MTQKILKVAKKFVMRTLVVGLAALLVLAVFVPVTRAARISKRSRMWLAEPTTPP